MSIVEVIVNKCHGRIRISDEALRLYNLRCADHGFSPMASVFGADNRRTDPLLIAIIRELGPRASTTYSDLVIHKGVEGYWGIEEYDGYELFDACCLTQPFIDIRALVFNESMSSADKIEHMKKAYREFDHISALGQTLNAQNPPDR